MSLRFYNSRLGAERKSHHVPTSRENREQLSACTRPLCLRLFPLSSLPYFLNHYSSHPPATSFLHPLPPMHQLRSRSKYLFRNFTNP